VNVQQIFALLMTKLQTSVGGLTIPSSQFLSFQINSLFVCLYASFV